MGKLVSSIQSWMREHWPLHPHTVKIVDMAFCFDNKTHIWSHTATRYRCVFCGFEFETSNTNAYRMLARGIRKEVVFVWQDADKETFIETIMSETSEAQEAK